MTDCGDSPRNMTMKAAQEKQPKISVVVVVYNMRREAERTLYSLSPRFQRGVCEDEYEVIVVDNGSTEPLSNEFVIGFGRNFRYFFMRSSSRSPAAAANHGIRETRGNYIGLMIDGARMVSPGAIKYALDGMKLGHGPVVATLSWHLGPDVQYRSMAKGYNRELEDSILAGIDWKENGYRLFDISSFAGASSGGFFLPIAESNCLFLTRRALEQLGGFDERFQAPGGGFVNLDLYKRACELPGSNLIIMLGEGTFHQVHGGVSTNVTAEQNRIRLHEFEKEYFEIRKAPFSLPANLPEFIGHIPREALRFMDHSVQSASQTLCRKTRRNK